MNLASIEVAGARLLAWADRRLREKSTIVGIADMAATLGYSALGANLTSHTDLIMMTAGALSAALAAASTKPRPPELLLTAPIASHPSPPRRPIRRLTRQPTLRRRKTCPSVPN